MPRCHELRSLALSLALLAIGCGEDRPAPAAPESPGSLVHLVDALPSARVESGSATEAAHTTLTWDLPDEGESWSLLGSTRHDHLATLGATSTGDALRLAFSAPPAPQDLLLVGGLEAQLGELRRADWDAVLVEARCSDRFAGVTIACNLDGDNVPGTMRFFASSDEAPPLFNDGSVQTYEIPLHAGDDAEPDEVLRRVAVLFGAPRPATLDVLSITLRPRGAAFLDDVGVRRVARSGVSREALFAHTPARLAFPVEVPAEGRFDTGLTANRGDRLRYRVSVDDGAGETLLSEVTVDDSEAWHQVSVDLAAHAGREVELILEADGPDPGAVALWGAPILSGRRTSPLPDVIFYVIDGGDADFMSLYEYGRPTTPFLEELAAEAVVFTRAHSNATWTQPSTVSFMTSLQHSVLGGLRRGIHSTSVPPGAVTMAEHMRRAGYQTASFTANPNAGRIIGTDRGTDLMRDVETGHHSTSSLELAEMAARFQSDYPGGPSWIHLQTTDVHEPNEPHAPFAGRFAPDRALERLGELDGQMWSTAASLFGGTSVQGFYDQALELAGIDRQEYFGLRRDLYDETMAHQDHALQELVEELKATGAWEHTLLVIGSDHGHPAGTFARFGRGLLDPQPEPWQGALCDAYATRVPLIFVWPGQIEGGRRIDDPVSMLDVLPTLLDLLDLPAPEVVQGQSLAPLLRGEELELAPVILDEFRVDEATGEMVGNIEIVDGRWGASLEIGPVPEGAPRDRGRHAVPAGGRWGAVHPYFEEAPRLLLFDLLEDPYTTNAVNAEHPDLVRRYTELLLAQWEAHQALAQRFGEAGETVPMTPEQLEQLRALGYIR